MKQNLNRCDNDMQEFDINLIEQAYRGGGINTETKNNH